MIERHITPNVLAALGDTPVVTITGARQAGKSTLAKALGRYGFEADYVTLDDALDRGAALEDPTAFVSGRDRPLIIDEAQRAPDLFLAIKAVVDEDRRPGSFLLTGSANVLTAPRISEALVGRTELIDLWPLSQGELEGRRERFVDRLFAGRAAGLAVEGESREEIVHRVLAGGYPEAVERPDRGRREEWFRSYVSTMLQREVRELANVAGLVEFPRLLRLLATRSSGLANLSSIGGDLGVPQTTLRRYVALLETVFLVHRIPAWLRNIGRRMVKSPKLYMADSGLMAHLLDADERHLERRPELLGSLLESFVAMELVKQASWSETKPALYHYRTARGEEADLVLERGGRIVGIEVKAGESVGSDDFRGLRSLAEAAGEDFAAGVVLHTGRGAAPFGPRLHALPVSALWARPREREAAVSGRRPRTP